jgi:hypothetical protein
MKLPTQDRADPRCLTFRPYGQPWGNRYGLGVADDRSEGDILAAIVNEGCCRVCGTPWIAVVRVDGDRAVKIEGGCPKEMCVLTDW